MKKYLILLLSSLTFLGITSSATAQTQYAYLNKLEKLSLQTDNVDLVAPNVAVSRGVIPVTDARHYKMVFANQNPALRTYTLTAKTTVSLLTFPNLAAKTTSLENLRLMIDNSESLPSEFDTSSNIFALTLSGNTVSKIVQVNTRAVTGVFDQAVYISKQSSISALKFMLDFVYAYTTEREMKRDGQTMNDNPGGLYISNNNPALRSFSLAKNGRIRLLKNAGEYVTATPKQLEDGLNGKSEGFYYFTWETHFEATISDVTGEILELKQGYEP